MEPQPLTNGLCTPPVPKMLPPPAAGCKRVAEQFYQERPMTLNAWTQTINEDAEYLRAEHHHHEVKKPPQGSENEAKLLEKIRVLEGKLSAQSELLSKIRTASAASRGPSQLQPSTAEHHKNNNNTDVCSPNSTSLINQIPAEPKETINYTIIADAAYGNVIEEPIEIHLAEGDVALNLQSSADSERLEIYIANEQQRIKTEQFRSEDDQELMRRTPPNITEIPTAEISAAAEETPSIKRPKIERKSSPTQMPPSNKNVSQHSVLESVDVNASSPSGPIHNCKQRVFTPIATYSTNTSGTASADPLPKKKSALKAKRKTLQSSNNQANVQKNGEGAMVSIGPNNTLIPEETYMNIPWKSASIATRRLLMTVFDRNTLATHSMTGKPSPAFKDQNKPLKKMLDRTKVEDILYAVTTKCNVTEKEVRNAITTKCADENKMVKLQMGKNSALGIVNKENVGSELHQL